MKRRKKKGINPVFAGCLLVAGVAVAGKTFLDISNGPAPLPADEVEIADPEIDEQASSGDEVKEVRWRDLLAAHGSFDGKAEVRVAFSILEEARGAAPGGETAAPTYWEGADPPELRLGVVMISEKSKRVVLGGQVVGISDEVAGVVVQDIARDRVVTLWDSKVLTYDLENGWPREFRAELARREREAADESESASESSEAVAVPISIKSTSAQESGK